MTYWDWSRLTICILAGMFVSALMSLPIIILSAFSEDRPAFWIIPCFWSVSVLGLFFSGAFKE